MASTVCGVVGAVTAVATAAVSVGTGVAAEQKEAQASQYAQVLANGNAVCQANDQMAAAMMGAFQQADPFNFFGGQGGMSGFSGYGPGGGQEGPQGTMPPMMG